MIPSNHRYVLVVVLSMGISTLSGMEQKEEIAPSYSQLAENIAIGSAAGASEVVAEGQLLTAAKNVLQRIEGNNRFSQFVSIVRNDPKILSRGFGVNMACMVPATAVQITTDKGLEKVVPGKDLASSMGRAYVAGALSALFFSCPIEMVALHQQIGKQNVYKTGKMLIAGKGMRKSITTLYRGVMPKIHRDGPFGVGLLVGYSRLKETFQSYTNDDRIAIVGAGAVSGGGVAAATHPFDRVSTFLQVDYKKERAKTMWDAFKIIYAEEGWRGFYKGISARVPRAAFAVPIIFTAQEEYRKILHKK